MTTQEYSELAVVEPGNIIILDEAHARAVIHNVDLLTRSFKQWLKEDVDYTRTLFGGSDKPSLLDPGAHKIMSFFQSYPVITVMQHLEDRAQGEERVKYLVQADVVHVSGVKIGGGVGSCSTDESKYQYRWLTATKLRSLGYSEAQIQALPSREAKAARGGSFTVYRVRNPDILDLDNTVLKMASKRAEVDATLSLPGVSGVFTQDIDQYPEGEVDQPRKKVESTLKKTTSKAKRDSDEKTEVNPTNTSDMRLDPKALEAEKAVSTVLEANGLPTEGFMILKYSDYVIVTPPDDITQDTWNDYDKVLRLIRGKWSSETHRWEVPTP